MDAMPACVSLSAVAVRSSILRLATPLGFGSRPFPGVSSVVIPDGRDRLGEKVSMIRGREEEEEAWRLSLSVVVVVVVREKVEEELLPLPSSSPLDLDDALGEGGDGGEGSEGKGEG